MVTSTQGCEERSAYPNGVAANVLLKTARLRLTFRFYTNHTIDSPRGVINMAERVYAETEFTSGVVDDGWVPVLDLDRAPLATTAKQARR